MLSKGDDYPIHQTPEPIAFVAGQRNFYDRYFFNGYDSDGEKFFAFALGVYPYLDVMDAAFSFVFDGVLVPSKIVFFDINGSKMWIREISRRWGGDFDVADSMVTLPDPEN